MSLDPPKPARTRRALLLVGIWLVPGLLQCVQEVTYARAQGAADLGVAHALVHFLPTWLPWALFTPWILALTERFPLTRGGRARALPVHALACLAFGGLHLVLLGLVRTTFPPGPWAPRELGAWLTANLWSLHSQALVLAYCGVVLAGHVLTAQRTLRARERRALRLEAQLVEARLAALRAQLQPHFLFNTLNSIDVLIQSDPARAGRMLRNLSALLRRTLDADGEQHALARELEHLRAYLDIERERFSDRLRVRIDADPTCAELRVPPFVLQPLVENALRHGIAPLADGGEVAVVARRVGGALVVEVEDDGAGLAEGAGEGLGHANTRARLREAYGDAASLHVERRAGGGTLARVSLPAEGGHG